MDQASSILKKLGLALIGSGATLLTIKLLQQEIKDDTKTVQKRKEKTIDFDCPDY
jgi:ThiF family